MSKRSRTEKNISNILKASVITLVVIILVLGGVGLIWKTFIHDSQPVEAVSAVQLYEPGATADSDLVKFLFIYGAALGLVGILLSMGFIPENRRSQT